MRRCLGLPQFEEVWVMPSGDRRDKAIPAENHDRLAMLQIIKTESFARDPRLHISSFELGMPQPTNTFDTLRALRRQFPHDDFWFAFGRDSYVSMPAWPHGTELQQQLPMVLFGDADGKIPEQPNIIYIVLPGRFSDMSATQVRRALADGTSLTGLVSDPIARYLQRFTSGSLFR